MKLASTVGGFAEVKKTIASIVDRSWTSFA